MAKKQTRARSDHQPNSGVTIGNVSGGIHGSVIAGGNVSDVHLGNTAADGQRDVMAQMPALQTLRDLLSTLYETTNDIQRVAQDAGLDTRHIDLNGKAVNVWHGVLAEAHKQGKMKAVVGAATLDYLEQSTTLQQAYQAYYQHS